MSLILYIYIYIVAAVGNFKLAELLELLLQFITVFAKFSQLASIYSQH